MFIEQPRRAELDLLGAHHPSAEPLDRFRFPGDRAGHVLGVVFVVLTLDVEVGLDVLDGFHGSRPGAGGDVVNHGKCADGLGAQPFVEDGSAGSLANEPVLRQGHDQHVTHLLGPLQVSNVARVEQVERSVAVDDGLAVGPQSPTDAAEIIQAVCFPVARHVAAWTRAPDRAGRGT